MQCSRNNVAPYAGSLNPTVDVHYVKFLQIKLGEHSFEKLSYLIEK